MAFIEIKKEEKNLYKFLCKLRDEKLSVELCNEILQGTNAYQVVKAMLNKINNQEIDEKKKYKEVIFSIFDGRSQRDEEKNVALSIAKECGFEEELNEVIKKSSPVIGKDICLKEKNLKGVKLKFNEGDRVDLTFAKNLPEDLDVSMCSYVNLSLCRLNGIELKFKDGAEVCLAGVRGVQERLDVSMCKSIDLACSNLYGVKEIIFKDEEQKVASAVEHTTGWNGRFVYINKKEDENVFNRLRNKLFGGR